MSFIQREVVKGMPGLKSEIMKLGAERVFLQPRLFGVPQMVTAGEHSRWLLALLERPALVGARCPKCGQIYAPAYLEMCGHPACRLQKLEFIDLPDVGVMAEAEPVITLFAPARMNGLAPFAHGYVYLQKGRIQASTAMMFAMETSKGVINPGVYKANTKVKVVFKDDGQREGSVRDMFCLPQSELTKEQIAKSPLFVSDIDWREPKPPVYPKNKALAQALPGVLETLRTFFLGVNKSPRNKARLRSVDFKVNVITGSGGFAIAAKGGAIKLLEKPLPKADAILAIKDPACFEAWAHGKALTNLFALGDLWLSNRLGVRLLEDLDRLWRAAHRDGTL